MDAVGKQFLARSCLTGDQYIGLRLAEFFCDVDFLPHLRVDCDDVTEGILDGRTLSDQALAQLPLLLQNFGGGAGGDQRTDTGRLTGDELVLHIVFLTAQVDDGLLTIPAGHLPAADKGQLGIDLPDGTSLPVLQKCKLVELIGPSVCLQNTARFIHGQHRVVITVQDHADDIGLGALGVDGAGGVQNLLHGPFQSGRPDIDIGTGNTPLPADIADSTAADNSIYLIPLAGVYRVIGAPLVHHLVKADIRMCKLTQSRQDGL